MLARLGGVAVKEEVGKQCLHTRRVDVSERLAACNDLEFAK
jgi:hypothetical protein